MKSYFIWIVGIILIFLIALFSHFDNVYLLLFGLAGIPFLYLLVKNDKFLIIVTIYTFIIDTGNKLLPIPLRDIIFILLMAKLIYYLAYGKARIKNTSPVIIIGILIPLYGACVALLRGGNPSYIFSDINGYIFLLTGLSLTCLVQVNNKLKETLLKHLLISTSLVAIGTVIILLLQLSGILNIYIVSTWLNNHGLGFAGLEINGQYRVFLKSHIYVMFALMIVSSQMLNNKKLLHIILFVLFTVSIVISNTRGLWLGTLIGFTYIFFTSKRSYKKIAFTISAGFILIAVSLFNQEFTVKVFERFSSSFEINTNQSNLIRATQSHYLLEEFKLYPIFGKGFGATLSSNYTRSELPYAFELSYLELLYKIGIIGFSLFLIGLFLFYLLIRKMNDRVLKIGLIGTYISFLLNSFTNPYIVSSLGTFLLATIFALSLNTKSTKQII